MTAISDGFIGAIGNTPLLHLQRLSAETGCTLLGKAEFMNPGGSVKDRAALWIIRDAEQRGLLRPGGTVVEGTAGNTGIGIAHICKARGYRCVIYMPDTQSQEKYDLLRTLGAEVRAVPAVPYADDNNYQKQAGRYAESLDNGVWANQFDNVANRQAHYDSTGPELWADTDGQLDGFICATGTGGTLAGVARYLKEQRPGIAVWAADPAGSAIASFVRSGELVATKGPSITEGIGSTRCTENLKDSPIDDALTVPDQDAVAMVYRLLDEEGLFLGSSSGINVCGAVHLARQLGPGHTIATILCDGGQRYQSRLFNPAFLADKGLTAGH